MSKIAEGIAKDLKAIPKKLKSKTSGADTKKLILLNLPYILAGYFVDKVAWLWRISEGDNASDKLLVIAARDKLSQPLEGRIAVEKVFMSRNCLFLRKNM